MDYINLETTETWLLNLPVIAFSDLVGCYWYYIKEIYRYEKHLCMRFRMQLDGDMSTCIEILHVYICHETILIALCFY